MRELKWAGAEPSFAEALSKTPMAQLWWRLFEAQTNVYFPSDLSALQSFLTTRPSFSLIDLGAGTGDFLLRLAEHCPQARLAGIDVSHEHIEYAKTRNPNPSSITFVESDIFDLPSIKHDIATMRLVLQHVSDHVGVLESLRRVVKLNGFVFLMEAFDPLTKFEPAVPELEKLYAGLKKMQDLAGGSRESIAEFKQVLPGSGFEVVSENRIGIEVATKMDAVALYALGAEVVRRKFLVDVSVETLIQEMTTWANTPGSKGQMGIVQLVLKKIK